MVRSKGGCTAVILTAVLAGIFFFTPCAVQAQAGNEGRRDASFPVARTLKVDVSPVVDGSLDEDVWQSAEVLGNFIQRIPNDGAPASEPTEVRVLYTNEALYVGAWLWDSEPDRIVDGEAIRNAPLDDSDAVLFVFDAFADRQNGFVFGTNPSGIEFDAQVTDEGRGSVQGTGRGGGSGRFQRGASSGFNTNWDGSWDVATSRDEQAWYAEFRIPFSTLRYGPGDFQTWGFNVMRRIRRYNEESYWSPVPRQYDLVRVSYAGFLEGIEPPASRNVTMIPYVLRSAARNYVAGDESFRYPGDVGVDAKVQVTSSLTLDLTVNTDFAEVEVDEVQLDLTRFSLRFPEKRPFFLENASIFNVAGRGTIFNSRRIGIRNGKPVPVRAGGRLSGRAHGFNLGLLHIQTGHEGDLLPNQANGDAFWVARAAREFPNRSGVGVFFAERRGRGVDGDWNRTYAMDGQVGIAESLDLRSYIALTETPGRDGPNHYFGLLSSYVNREWQLRAGWRDRAGDFNPEVGVLTRWNFRFYQISAMRLIRPDRISWLREIRPHVNYTTFRNLETGFEQTTRIRVNSPVEFENGALFSPGFSTVREGLVEPFEIHPDVTVAPGVYDTFETAWQFNTDQSAALSLSGGINAGGFLSGNRRAITLGTSARHGSLASASLQVTHNDIRLAEGDFTATIVAGRVGYFPTPRIALQSLFQYSSQLDVWSANIRLGWLGTAGTGLFIVYNDSRGVGLLEGPMARSLVVKYSREFNVGAW
tara:strand:- start:5099 stop:7369 length:2271 start_codon:yes stop_codon:yes gene_type:complete